MIWIQLRSRPSSSPCPSLLYQLAGQQLITDVALPFLAPFLRTPLPTRDIASEKGTRDQGPRTGGGDVAATESSDFSRPAVPSAASSIYNGRGWIGGQWQTISLWKTSESYHIFIADREYFTVTVDGSAIVRHSDTLVLSSPLFAEIILGPVLLLAFALKGIFCLHGSAVAQEDGTVVAFLGSSGAGKSTLGYYLSNTLSSSWKSVADDVIPVTLVNGHPVLLPNFPQLKWESAQQPTFAERSRFLLRCLYLLDAPEVAQPARVLLHPVNGRNALLALLAHIHAARLFDAELLTHQLDFCDQVAQAVSMRQLQYPRCFASLPLVTEAIRRDLAVHTGVPEGTGNP